MSNIYLDRAGADGCVSKINSQIEALNEAASAINSTMGELQGCWKGTSADRAQQDYAENYQHVLSHDVPEMVEGLKQFIDGCVKAIYDTDAQLGGGA